MSDYIFAFLLVVHIAAIVGWMGAATLFASVLGPSLAHMEREGRAEFLVKIVPRYTRYVGAMAGLSIVFGVALYGYALSAKLLPTGNALLLLQAGAVVGLVAFILAFAIVIPSSRNLTRLVNESRSTPQPQGQAEVITRTQQKLRMATGAISGLLLVVLILMVLGATL